jgi:hypothetical protein
MKMFYYFFRYMHEKKQNPDTFTFSCVYASFLTDQFYEKPSRFGKESGKCGFYYMAVFLLN